MITGLHDIEPLWNLLWADGDIAFVNAWVDLHSWWVWLIQLAVILLVNEPYNSTDAKQNILVTLLSWFIASPLMKPALWATEWLWLPTWLYFLLQPEDFVDADGKVLPGFPSLFARTRDMFKMHFFNPAPFRSNLDRENLTLEFNDFFIFPLAIIVEFLRSD